MTDWPLSLFSPDPEHGWNLTAHRKKAQTEKAQVHRESAGAQGKAQAPNLHNDKDPVRESDWDSGRGRKPVKADGTSHGNSSGPPRW